MEIIEILRGLTAEDGLNIPATTLAIYCGMSQQAFSQYITGKSKPNK